MDMRVVFLIALLFIPLGEVSAVFYNNTETIEIGDGEPDLSPNTTDDEGDTSVPIRGNTPSEEGGATNEEGSDETASNSNSEESSGGSASGATPLSLEEMLNLLLQAGAFLNARGGGGGGGTGLDASQIEAGVDVRIMGEKVRELIQNNLDLRNFLASWRPTGREGKGEYSLIAASTAARDMNVEEVLFSASAFEIVYRSRGYLLMVIPWSFPVEVFVVPDSPVLSERVQVTLPWYSFFIRKFFTKAGLQKDIDEVLVEVRTENTAPDTDGTALFFEAVAQYLRQKVGTISQSVYLGTSNQE